MRVAGDAFFARDGQGRPRTAASGATEGRRKACELSTKLSRRVNHRTHVSAARQPRSCRASWRPTATNSPTYYGQYRYPSHVRSSIIDSHRRWKSASSVSETPQSTATTTTALYKSTSSHTETIDPCSGSCALLCRHPLSALPRPVSRPSHQGQPRSSVLAPRAHPPSDPPHQLPFLGPLSYHPRRMPKRMEIYAALTYCPCTRFRRVTARSSLRLTLLGVHLGVGRHNTAAKLYLGCCNVMEVHRLG